MRQALRPAEDTHIRWAQTDGAARLTSAGLVPLASAGLAALTAAIVLTDHRALKLILVLPALAIVTTVRSERLLVTWLFAAPLVQGAAARSNHGHLLYTGLFLVPPLVVAVRMLREGGSGARLGAIDALPAVYFGYVLILSRLFHSNLASGDTSLRGIYSTVGIGSVAYYLIAFGRYSKRFPVAAVKAILWSGVVAAVLALVDGATAWTVWHTSFGEGTIHRATSTFKSPFDLGSYLGMSAVLAVAVLVWRGPRELRLPATVMLWLAAPALVLTYTRGPIVATVGVAVLMLLVARRTRWRGVFAAVVIGLTVFVAWGEITSSSIYSSRLSVTSTVTDRVAVQQVSLELIRLRPWLGWGYSTFDQAKLLVPTSDETRVETTTSHNTFLTVLVELGVVGLAMLVLPWLVILRRALAAAMRGSAPAWVVAGCAGAVAVYVISAFDYDTRFFPLVLAMPLILVGLARRTLADTTV